MRSLDPRERRGDREKGPDRMGRKSLVETLWDRERLSQGARPALVETRFLSGSCFGTECATPARLKARGGSVVARLSRTTGL